ncbi:MAG: ATP-binding protein, partial [Planctomycetota bacterium JB042]
MLARIAAGFEVHPIVVLLGPRQAGKTTLAREFVIGTDARLTERNYFDLEDPTDLGRLESPKLALAPLSGTVVIDEVQRAPELFPLLRTLVDRPDNAARFLILGSASRDLIRQSSETLAGRVSFLEVHPFSGTEVDASDLERLWVRGGFPRAYLADSDDACSRWREAYVRTYLERDVPALGIDVPANTLRRLWLMLAHHHGQVLNLSELGRSIGVSHQTIDRYVDILAGTFMVRRLAPWFENIGKRQVKRPKVYFRDSGIFHQFLGVETRDQLDVHPRLGASWEGFALEEVIRSRAAAPWMHVELIPRLDAEELVEDS